ncbi:MAG: fumarate hydratase [bacterium]|nr:fumarate hydratase [bacterium]
MKAPRTFAALTAQDVANAVREAIPAIATSLRPDVLSALGDACACESDRRAQGIIAQIIENDAIGRRDGVPICQDTGSVWIYLEVGEELSIPAGIFSLVDEAVADAFTQAKLRMSILADALVDRTNTKTNTPVFTEIGIRPGKGATLHVMLKGGGSDNASRVIMLPPGAGFASIREEVRKCVLEKGSAACPPLIIGIGIGATFDKVGTLAKKALLRPVGVPNPDPRIASLEQELLDVVNATGVGPAGLGGASTALSIAINTAPCHIAALPLAINMGCCAMRSVSIELADDGVEIAEVKRHEIELSQVPEAEQPIEIRLPASKEQLAQLRAGQSVTLTGAVYTMRDAGHVRTLEALERDGALPFGLDGATLLYAGPTPESAGRPLGSVGPTTASRMDFATPALYASGIASTIGKGARSSAVARACKDFGCVHFTAVGGIAALLATYVKSAEPIAWPDLGTEALVRLEVEGLPAFVGIDTQGNDIFSALHA